MDYIYTTHVAVPESAIRKICTDLLRNTLHECAGEDIDMNQGQLMLLGRKMNGIMDSMCRANRVTVEGWDLTNDQIKEIASELHEYRKIGAIKAFRSATDTGLKEAKDLIDVFCHGPRKDSGPLAALAFEVAFKKQ